ncbi:MAG: hypothetical protein IPO35_12040 [Uliginosibacterium sp.]|nr:hypothetical protein [Uliginosibacterium sp.]
MNGLDTNDGRSPAKAWKTLDQLHKVSLVPGDVVRLARGSVFKNQHLLLDHANGSASAPVIIEAYGTGEPPTIDDPRALWDKTKRFDAVGTSGAYIHILDIRVRNAASVQGVNLGFGSHHVVVGGMEIDAAAGGISVSGEHHKILSNYIHDIGSKGSPSGGICVLVVGKDLEFAWNRLVSCVVNDLPTPDGSAFEYYGYVGPSNGGYNYVSDDIRIHHNYIDSALLFMEAYGAVTRMQIAYNVYVNGAESALEFHFDHTEPLDTLDHKLIYDVKIENNTIVPLQPAKPGGWGVVGMLRDLQDPARNTDPMLSSIVLRNNLIVTNHKITHNAMGAKFVHDHNIYWLTGAGKFDTSGTASLGSSDRILDPQFVSFSLQGERVNTSTLDLRLKATSPAINAGATAGYAMDYLKNPVPRGGAPDIGAYEF